MARVKKSKKIGPVLFIACEGTSSEYQYFESWAKLDKTLETFQQVNVYPDENELKPKTTPYQLFEIAKKELSSGAADIAWIVFDKDNHPRLTETFQEAKLNNIKIAFSSRSFEEWVLMHYLKDNTVFNATECKDDDDHPINCGTVKTPNCNPINCLTGHIRRLNLIPKYSKKKDFDLFTAIFTNTEKAIVNSAWLRAKSGVSLYGPEANLSVINPYTDVDQLILKLNGRNDIIEWGQAGTDIKLGDWTVNVTKRGNDLVMRLSHQKEDRLLVNTIFSDNHFATTDDNLSEMSITVKDKKIIINENGSNGSWLHPGDIIEYTLIDNNQPYFLFKQSDINLRIYIEL